MAGRRRRAPAADLVRKTSRTAAQPQPAKAKMGRLNALRNQLRQQLRRAKISDQTDSHQRQPQPPPRQEEERRTAAEEVMSGETLVEFQQQFNSSRRAGRRNAMADLGLEGVDPGAHQLAAQFERMGCEPGQAAPAGTSAAAPAHHSQQ